MIYLLAATACSAAIALIFKFSEGKGLNRYAVTSVNYLAAVAVSAALIASEPMPFTSWRAGLMVGVPAGVCFFMAFLFYQISVRDSGAGLAGMFGKLGILMPMLLSLALWREFPTAIQSMGIALAICAIVSVSLQGGTDKGQFYGALLALFFFGGLSEFSNKLFQRYGVSSEKAYFLIVVFAVAFLTSLIMTLRHGEKPTRLDLITGAAVGIPNLFSSFFLIRALDFLPTAVVFPVYSAGSMALIILMSRILYGERLHKRSLAAVALTMLALVMINLG